LEHQEGVAEDEMQDKLTGNPVRCLTHLSLLFAFSPPDILDDKLFGHLPKGKE